jgi:hypothetical protein
VQPQITQVQETSEHFIALSLNYSFSDSAEIILERKTTSAFEQIPFKKQSSSVWLDTNFTRESDYNFVYRVKVQKNVNGITYSTAYSTARSFSYLSTTLNAPENVYLQTLELQGVKILWEDKSGKEDGYKVEKNSGSGFTEIATLSANSTSYMDTISGTPTPPLNLTYRVKAYNATLASSWKEISTVYSGLGSPTNLAIVDSSFWKFTIQWQRNSSIATGYNVERKKDANIYVTLANVGATISSYVDTLKDSGSYFYRVKAKKDNLYSAYSNEVVYNLTEVLPTQGLVAYYPFNGNANDESGNNHNGTVIGANLTVDRFGYTNRAYSFNGTNSIIVVNNANSPGLEPSNEMTMSCFINTNDNSSATEEIIRKAGPWQTGYILRLQSNGNLEGIFGYPTEYKVGISRAAVRGNWFHILITASKTAQTARLYVNGIVRNTNSSFYYNFTHTSSQLSIGGFANGTSYEEFFNGKIDDVRIYGRALTEQEIQALYHEGGWH